jgi:GrpB-like predicted nucleotidyltransferase (UPF0157 family)
MSDQHSRSVSLGLHRAAVELRPYDPSWAMLGERERSTVAGVLAELANDVQHVGSTAVPGLDAKPILDIAVALDPTQKLSNRAIAGRMESAGYHFVTDSGPDGGLLFVRAQGDIRTVHVHVISADDPEWARYIRFRDLLRTRPELRRSYERLKHQLAVRFAGDRTAYTDAKAVFVAEVLQVEQPGSR